MTKPSGIYSTMIQEVNIPSGMLMPELGKVGPYCKYVQFPIDEEQTQQWCDEHLMDYQKDFIRRMEEQQWTDEILLRNQYWDYIPYLPPRLFLIKDSF